MSSSSNNNSNNSNGMDSNARLLITAVTAAAAGAALAIQFMKKQDRYRDRPNHKYYHRGGSSGGDNDYMPSLHSSQKRSSFIYEQASDNLNSLSGGIGGSGGGGGGGGGVSDETILFPHNHEERMRRRIAARVAVEEDNLTPRKSVTVRVPATSANVGPGYDCIGMAVDLWSEVTVTRAEEFSITAEGEGAEQMPKDETNLMVTGVKAAFDAASKPMPILKYHVISRIPYARGLGSSSAAIVAGIIAGLVLAGHRLPCWGSEALLQIAASIEGHPDNVAPAIYGGIQIGIHNGTRWVTERAPLPAGMQLVMFMPDFIGKTSDARGVLEDTVTRYDAAFNISRAAFLIHALCSGNLDNLKWGVQDKMHQPQRGEKLYPYLFPMIEAAEAAGANCVYLSGAGPTVMALTSGASGDIFTQREKERTDSAVAHAMILAAEQFGIQGKVMVTQAAHEGARVVKVEPPFSTGPITYRDNI